jgi:hypothetical protein
MKRFPVDNHYIDRSALLLNSRRRGWLASFGSYLPRRSPFNATAGYRVRQAPGSPLEVLFARSPGPSAGDSDFGISVRIKNTVTLAPGWVSAGSSKQSASDSFYEPIYFYAVP